MGCVWQGEIKTNFASGRKQATHNTVMFVSDVYTHSGMDSKCIDYKSFYRNGDNVVLGDYTECGFLKDHNIGASYNKNYWFSDYYSARDYFDSIYDKNKANKLLMSRF